MGNESVSVSIDKDAVQGFVAAAIMEQIGQDQRDQVIAQAVTSLLQSNSSGYPRHDSRSVLQIAFDGAAAEAARQIVKEEFDKPEVRAAITEMLSPMIVNLCEGNYDGLPERIGEGVATWLREGRRD